MQVEFLSKFSKDLDRINVKSVKSKLIALINQIETAENLIEIQNIKKLVGHKSAYRIRVADYRVGIFYENGKVIFARVAHRKDIYNLFP
jgi:mRNA interferase RelE/StbE